MGDKGLERTLKLFLETAGYGGLHNLRFQFSSAALLQNVRCLIRVGFSAEQLIMVRRESKVSSRT